MTLKGLGTAVIDVADQAWKVDQGIIQMLHVQIERREAELAMLTILAARTCRFVGVVMHRMGRHDEASSLNEHERYEAVEGRRRCSKGCEVERGRFHKDDVAVGENNKIGS